MDYSVKKAAMIAAGQILNEVISTLEPDLIPGITTQQIDQKATQLIRKLGGEPGFQKVPGYNWATCLSVNEVVVHGIPNQYKLQKHDLLKLDIGVFLDGYHTDYGRTYCIGNDPTPEIAQFMSAGKETLDKAISLVKMGNHLGLVSQLIEESIHAAGYEILYNLTGHAVGRTLHEDPLIPQFLSGRLKNTPVFEAGVAYAVEIIYSQSDSEISEAGRDGWSLRTKKGSQSAFWENTIFVTEKESLKIGN